jgi:DNA recombination protein RmuC
MEIAGLLKDRDYKLQVTEGSSRMDAVVYLPDGRCIVVDSKVPLNDYSAYCDAQDDGDRERYLKAHTAAVRGFVDDLSRKDYSALFEGRAPDFTIMLIPLEPAFGAAFKADGTLMDYALARRVIPTSTASLVATLRVIENLWKIDAQNRNVQEIAGEAGKLLQYIELFVGELSQVGMALDKAKEVHDSAVRRITVGGQGSIKATSERLQNLGAKMVAGPGRRKRKVSPSEPAGLPSVDLLVNSVDMQVSASPDGDSKTSTETGIDIQPSNGLS